MFRKGGYEDPGLTKIRGKAPIDFCWIRISFSRNSEYTKSNYMTTWPRHCNLHLQKCQAIDAPLYAVVYYVYYTMYTADQRCILANTDSCMSFHDVYTQ